MKKILCFLITAVMFSLNISAKSAAAGNGPGDNRRGPVNKIMISQQPGVTNNQRVVTASDGTPVTLYGCILSSSDPSWSQPGIYSFPSDKGYPFTSVAKDLNVYGGGTIAGNEYYAIYYLEEGSIIHMPVTLTVYDAETWKPLREYKSPMISSIATDLAYDHQTKNIYGCFMNDDYSATQTFGRLVFNDVDMSYSSEEIGQFPERMMGLTVDELGQLYSIGSSGKLYKVNKSTGDVTVIGDTGVGSMQWGWQSACFDKASGKIFWAGNNDMFDQCLFEVNPADATTKTISNYSDCYYEQIVGMFIKQEFEEVKAPNPVSSFAIEFNDANLTGGITFTIPSTYTDGSAIEDAISYKITLNSEEYETKACKAGEVINKNITVPADDIYTIAVSVTVGGVESEASQIVKYIGNDTPQAVDQVMSVMHETTDNSIEIVSSWDAVTESLHGGYMDVSAMKYNVVRFPDEVMVAEGISETTFTDRMDANVSGRFHYEVTAVCNGMKSEPRKSNMIKIGGITEYPYSEDFADVNSFDNFTVVDANEDGCTWTYENGKAAYNYSPKNAADDWLITPGFAMKANKYYILKFKANNSYPTEKVEAYAGNSDTAEAMTTKIIETTEVTYGNTAELSGSFQPEKDGVYYFGIKAVSDPDKSTLYVDDIIVEEKSANAPKAVEDLEVKAGEKGALKAYISFTTPTQCVDDSELTDIKCVRISCNGDVIKEMKNALPGTHYDIEDNEGVSEGNRKYTVEVQNETGFGKKAEKTVYVGIDIPGKVLNLKASEDLDEEGTVILTWDAPSIGQNGGYVDPEGLTYIISKGGSPTDIDNGNSRVFRDKLDVSAGKQVYEGYNVYAENDRGSGRNVWQTIVTVAGPSVIAPMYESLSGMHMSSGPWVPTMIKGEIGEASWIPVDGSCQASGTQDNDGGVWVYKATAGDKQCRIESPKVDIRQLSDPQVAFWLYANSKDVKVAVSVQSEFGEFEEIGTAEPVDNAGWTRFSFNLSKYKDSRFIRLGFTGNTSTGGQELFSFDNISVSESAGNNLQLVNVMFPQRTIVGKNAEFTVNLRNSGQNEIAVDDFTVELYKNGELADIADGVDMAVGSQCTLGLFDQPTVSDKAQNVYQVKINYPGDEYDGDNESEEVTIDLEYPTYPVVTDVNGTLDGGAVSLSWKAPDLANMSGKAVTESFETYNAFDIDNIGDWTMYDGDKCNTIKISLGAGPLEYNNAGKPMAFQVFNSLEAGIPFSSWIPKTGEQMIVAFATVTQEGDQIVQNDDWIISPELNGEAQTISFYAKSGMNTPYIPEELEVLYSTTDKEIGSFKKLGETIELENAKSWDFFKFDLPEGAKYFALRCVSNYKFALLIDDITYTPKGAEKEDLTLVGYNVYRDDVRLNEEPVLTTSFVDGSLEADNDYRYNVTAVYDKLGESRYSEPLMINTTGIENIENGNSVDVVNGGIVISGNDDKSVAVYDTAGVLVYAGKCSGNVSISLQQGNYIVKIGNASVKVCVR